MRPTTSNEMLPTHWHEHPPPPIRNLFTSSPVVKCPQSRSSSMCAKSKTGKTSRKARPDKVKEKAEIAAFRRAIGVSEPTFADWRRMPGAPVTLDVEQWRAFIVENGLGVRGSRPMPAREAHLTDNVARRNRL